MASQQVQVTIIDPNSLGATVEETSATQFTITLANGQQVQVTSPAGVPIVQQVQV